MVVEDHLRKMKQMTGPNPHKPNRDTLVPRQQHSCFGDFPKTHLAKGAAKAGALTVEPVNTDLGAAQQSAANPATQQSKLHHNKHCQDALKSLLFLMSRFCHLLSSLIAKVR